MKKYFTLLILLCFSLTSFSQFRFAALVGYDNTNLKFKQNLIQVDPVSGFKAGVMGEMMFPGIGFGLDIGLLYSMRGANLHLGDKEIWASDGYGTERSFLHYIEIPVNLKFKWTRMNGLEDYIAPFVFGGPTFSLMAGHSHLPALQYAGGSLGLQVGFGLELWKVWQIQGAYNWGMTYAVKTVKLEDFSARDRMWSISLLRYF